MTVWWAYRRRLQGSYRAGAGPRCERRRGFWVTPIQLTQIIHYPVKSAAGIQVQSWEVDGFGLRHDRRWMVVDPAGRHVTQRTHPGWP